MSPIEWSLLILLLIIVPLSFWFRVRTINRRKSQVFLRCPKCHADQRLAILRNYHCKQCGDLVRFFDDEGTQLLGAETYQCEACDSTNFVGVVVCTVCGMGNQAGVPVSQDLPGEGG